jgi:hypothetical protein
MRTLKPYFVYDTEPAYGAVLVFDYSARAAKLTGFHQYPNPDSEFVDMRMHRADDKWMRERQHDRPHVIDTYGGGYDSWEEYYTDKYEINCV